MSIALDPGPPLSVLDGLGRPPGDVDQIRARAAALTRRCADHEAATAAIRSAMSAALASWTGPAAASFADYTASLLGVTGAAARAYADAATTLTVFADTLDFAQQTWQSATTLAHDPHFAQTARTCALGALDDARHAAHRAASALTLVSDELRPVPPPTPRRHWWTPAVEYGDGFRDSVVAGYDSMHDLLAPIKLDDPSDGRRFSDALASFASPRDLAEGMIDWDDLSHQHYAHWLGELSPAALITLFAHEPLARAGGRAVRTATDAGLYLRGMGDVAALLARTVPDFLPAGWTIRYSGIVIPPEPLAMREILADARGKMFTWTSQSTRWSTNQISFDRTLHTLFGEAPGRGGHAWPGRLGKTPFPPTWTPRKIAYMVSDIANDPAASFVADAPGNTDRALIYRGKPARFVKIEMRDGVRIKVVYEPLGEGIVTAYPD